MAEKTRFYYLCHGDVTGGLIACVSFSSLDDIHCIHKAQKKVDSWNVCAKRLGMGITYSLSPTPTINTSTNRCVR